MDKKEFVILNDNNKVPVFDIGQGFGYKVFDVSWDDIREDEIIYIPEYAYDKVGHVEFIDDAYTKNDFRRIIKDYYDGLTVSDKDVEIFAIDLFDVVDWQYPESLLNEGIFDDMIADAI